jgi:hypothetical protein
MKRIPQSLRTMPAVALALGLAALPGRSAAEAARAPAFGKAETSRWTATTWEAAAAEANRKVLESGRVATVTGEIVDVSCYLQLGKRGEAHVACGTKCIRNGQPIGIVDAEGQLYLLMPEEHHPRRDGELDLKQVFLPYLAKTVTVTGMATDLGGYHALFVQGKEIGAGKRARAEDRPMEKKPEGGRK